MDIIKKLYDLAEKLRKEGNDAFASDLSRLVRRFEYGDNKNERRVFVWFLGDHSVGIDDTEITFDLPRDLVEADDSRKIIRDAFSMLCGGEACYVLFDGECGDCGSPVKDGKCTRENCVSREPDETPAKPKKQPKKKIMVFAQNYWGVGDTEAEAKAKARKAGWSNRRQYVVFEVVEGTRVNEMGDISYPKGFPPKEIKRVGLGKSKKGAKKYGL